MENNKFRRVRLATFGAGLALICVLAYPISTFYTRALSIFLIFGVCALVAVLSWRFRIARAFYVVAGLVVAGFLLGPGRGVEDSGLADRYASELLRYRGTAYVWGGENRLGIDCSGLVRSALVNAAIARGVGTLNPELVRFGISLWWHDRTARELGEGYRGETVPVSVAASTNAAVVSDIRVGDLAVTASGLHVLAYAGNGTWVEADPTAHEVLVVRVPEPANPWFNMPVKIVRWRVLVGAGS